MDARRLFGDEGESLASAFLREKGYRLLATQYRAKGGEIDLIAKFGDEIVFVEVKTRRSRTFGHPESAVTPEKVRRLLRAVHQYLQANALEAAPWRIDVISIEMEEGNKPHILHFEAIDMPGEAW